MVIDLYRSVSIDAMLMTESRRCVLFIVMQNQQSRSGILECHSHQTENNH